MTPNTSPTIWERVPAELARALFARARDAALLLDATGRVADANPVAAALFGRPLAGADVRELLEGDGSARVPPADGGYHLRTAAGARVPVRASAIPLGDSTGHVLLIRHDRCDPTDWERAERAEADYRNALESSLQGVMIHQDARIRYANPALARMFGYDGPADLVGRHLWDTFVLPEHLPALQARTAALLAGEALPPHPGWCAVGKDGRRLWVSTSASRVEWEGRPAVVAFYLNISEQKQAEEGLRASERFVRAITAASPHTMYVFDRAEGRNVWANRQITDDLGYTPDQVRAMGADFFARLLHPDDIARLPALLARWETAADDDVIETEYRMRHADDSWRWFLSHDAVFARGSDGRVAQFLGTAQDITARKRAEAERLRLEAQVLQAQKLESLGVLAGGIAHDFNNLLTSVLGYSGLAALDLPPGSATRAMIGEIEKAATRAAELTGQMLAYSGRGKFVSQTIELDGLVREMHALLLTGVSKKAVVRLELAPVAVEADAAQVRQVVMNLLTNASDALDGRPGAITVRTGARALAEELRSPFVQEVAPPGGYAFLEVEDTGCGMTEDTLARIFDPFFTTKFTGRGLGLAAVLGIVRGHKGSLQIDTAPGRGTTFRVFLPTAVPAPPVPPAVPRGNGRVLVVDDEESVRALVRRVLEEGGFEVQTAADGRQALQVLSAHRGAFRAVLLDLTMPYLDGWEVASRIQAEAPGLPVVMMSGYCEEARRDEWPNVAGFIQKPFRAGDLLDRICRAAR